MAKRKQETPFDKIMTVRSKLSLYVQYGDAALQGQEVSKFIADVNECFEHLMTFRNIVNGMASFEQTPERAVLPYLPNDVIQEASAA